MDCRRTLAEGRFLGLYVENGWEYAARPHAGGVVGILPVTPTRDIVLIEQFRTPVGRLVIEIPAGVVGDQHDDPDESPESAGRRELLEETGYEAATMTGLGATPSSAGMTTEVVHLFLATGLKRLHDGGGVDNERIIVHHVPRTGLAAWLSEREADGALVDYKIMASLWIAEEHQLI
jgi:ADP-ribose pyrophosphatase